MKKCKGCGEEKSDAEFNFKVRLSRYCSVCVKKYRKITRLNHRRGAMKTAYSNAWYTKKYGQLKYFASKRGVEFSISKDEYKKLITVCSKCHYCKRKDLVFSVDRKDNNAPYILANCVACCWRCNKLKGSIFSEWEMVILGNSLRKIDLIRAKKAAVL